MTEEKHFHFKIYLNSFQIIFPRVQYSQTNKKKTPASLHVLGTPRKILQEAFTYQVSYLLFY